MSSLRDGLLDAAGRIALRNVGASNWEIDQILSNPQSVSFITTWPDHQAWARTALAQLRARHAEELGNPQNFE